MRTALCFYGQPRHIEKCWPSIKSCVAEPNNSDIFFHFWSNLPKKANAWSRGEDVKWKVLNEYELCELLRPKAYILEPQMQFNTKPYPKAASPVFNFMSFLYSLKRSHLLYDKDDYDVIIHCRSDLLFKEKLLIREVESNTLYLEFRGASGDQFAYGRPDVMRIFSSCFDSFGQLYQQLGEVHAETFFRTHMPNNGIKIVPAQAHYSLIRHVEDIN